MGKEKKGHAAGGSKRRKGALSRLAAENMCLWMLISQEGLLEEARDFIRENMDIPAISAVEALPVPLE